MTITTVKRRYRSKTTKEEFIGLVPYSEVPEGKKGWYIFASVMAILGSLSMMLLMVNIYGYGNSIITIVSYVIPLICVLGMSLGVRKSCYKLTEHY